MQDESVKIDVISAAEVTIEVKDAATGRIFHRSLPLDYYENDNGIRLSGEDIDGAASHIIFFSEKALGKITDLMGRGPNESHCDGHD